LLSVNHIISDPNAKSPEQDEEVSLSELLSNIRSDKELSDLTLRSSDGELIHASRNILAGRSKVFRAMLIGKYSEAGQSEVKVGFEGRILKSIVDYCYTDEIEQFDILAEEPLSLTRAIIQLYLAADYFGLTQLKVKAAKQARRCMHKCLPTACTFFNQALANDAIMEEIKDLALSFIRKSPKAVLMLDPSASCTNEMGVNVLSQSAVSEILQDPYLEEEEVEVILFQALEAWSKASNPEPHEAKRGGNNNSNQSKKRKDAASELSHFIRLKRIKPSDLSTTVASSGLISSDRLFDAFKDHALCRENNMPLVTRRKAVLEWFESGDEEFSPTLCVMDTMLYFEAFQDGQKHAWSICIEAIGVGRCSPGLAIACYSELSDGSQGYKCCVCDFSGRVENRMNHVNRTPSIPSGECGYLHIGTQRSRERVFDCVFEWGRSNDNC
jgi:hypothetical protein